MTKVSVKRSIDQVADGIAYKGYITIAETTLDYELNFAIPISKTKTMPCPKDRAEARRIFRITVKKGGSDTQLTDKEWGVFFNMLVMFAAEFYYLPQTRVNNESPIIGCSLRGERHAHSGMAEYGMGMTCQTWFDFHPDLCAMLNAPQVRLQARRLLMVRRDGQSWPICAM